MRLAAVVLYDYGTDAYVDTRAMFDYTYGNFSKISLMKEEKPKQIEEFTDPEAYVVLPPGVEYKDLEMEITVQDEKEGTGRVTYFYQNQNVGSTDVTLTPEYIESATGYTTRLQISGASEAGDDVRENGGIPMWGKVLLCAGAACVILAVILTLILVRIRRRRKQRRMRRRRQQIKEMRGRGGKRRRYTGRRRG